MIVTQNYIIYDLPLQEWESRTGWQIKSVRDIATVIGGGTPDTGNPEYWSPSDIMWATPTDISASNGVFISHTERSISRAGAESCAAIVLPPNSVLLTSRATIGECRINTVPIATNQGFASLVPNPDTNHLFLYYLAQYLKPALVRLACGSTYLEVSKREIRRIRFGCPAPDEQRTIGEVLFRVDRALSHGKTDTLLRLRKVLIQNLLTGKVRVKPSETSA